MNTGELQKYIDQQFSGMKNDIQKSTSGYKDIAVMQVKAELGTEYQKIIQDANSGISNRLAIILGIVGVLIPVLTGLIGRFFYNQVNKILANVKKTGDEISGIQEDVDKFVKSQKDDIFDKVMEKIIAGYFQKIGEHDGNWSNLFGVIYATDKKYVSAHYEYYNILSNIDKSTNNISIVGAIYQFFPGKLFKDKKIKNFIKEMTNGAFYTFGNEILEGNKEIFNEYIEDKTLINELILYVNGIFSNIQKGYSNEEKSKIIHDLEKHMKEVGLGEKRNDIINSPKVEVNKSEITMLTAS